MITISSNDILTIVSRKEIADAVEQAMLAFETGDFIMPDRMHIHRDDNTMLLMPCVASGVMSTKLVSIFPNNSAKGLPSLFGTLLLNDGATGEPLALIDGATITALRTGAVGGVGVRYLAKKDAKSLMIVGTGVQGRNLVLSACIERDIERVFAFDIYFERVEKFIKDLKDILPNVEFIPISSINQGIKEADILITATTSSVPVLPANKSLLANKCIIGVGSFKPNTREIPHVAFSLTNRIFVDTPYAAKECGDLAIPISKGEISEENILTLGKFILKPYSHDSTTIFKTVGMALFDLFTAKLIYQKALEKGVGEKIKL